VARALATGRAKEPPITAQEIEARLPDGAALGSFDAEVPELWFLPDLSGYAWVFRKGDYLNVGLGRHGGDVQARMRAFLRALEDAGRIPRGWDAAVHGHAYLVYGRAQRPLTGRGVALVGDAAGLAHPKSGEGIRPAVESGLLLARAVAARGPERPEALAAYAAALAGRFGPRRASDAEPRALPAWQASLGRRLLSVPAFARRVVVDRWFLNRGQPALA
jgi:flavin-dependent dehydrogenase